MDDQRPQSRFGTVTVAIPTYNRESYLKAAAQSVLAQTYPDLEILIGDNASTDGTEAFATELARGDERIRYIRHPSNLGMVGNFNALLQQAKGDFFLLLSDDDLLAPRAVEELVRACASPGIVFAYSPALVMDGAGTITGGFTNFGPAREDGATFIVEHLADRRSVALASVLHRIAPPAERVYFSERIGYVCDFLVRLKLALEGDVACVPLPLIYYRVHAANETLNAGPFAESLLRMLDDESVTTGPLKRFAPNVARYVHRHVRELALGAASRGRKKAARDIVSVVDRYGYPATRLRVECTLLGTLPGRGVAAARRWFRRRKVAAIATPPGG